MKTNIAVLAFSSVLVASVATAATSAKSASEGPATSVRAFLGEHLDASIPALKGVPALLRAGDLAGAEKAFAAHLRASLPAARIVPGWTRGTKPSAKVREIAADVMNYRLSAVGFRHPFPPHGVDWVMNPTIGSYQEWPWQLSRHQDLTTLAEYYARTGDEKAAEIWVELVDSWLNQAVYEADRKSAAMRACWRTLDAAIRLPRWTRQIAAFKDSPHVSDHFLARLGASVFEHGRHLRAHPTLSGGNWLITEMHGLLHISLFYGFCREAAEWRAFAERKLREQYTGQVYPDGFQVETTTDYQSCLIHGFLGVAHDYRMAGEKVPDYIYADFKKAFMIYPRLSRPDRCTPGLNDGGCASVAHWSREALAVYPDDPTFRWFATDGREGMPPPFLSDAFSHAGYVTFRDSWRTNAVWGFFDAGADHWRGWHSHEDALNVLLSAYGRNMLVEPGNYRYDTSEMRKYVITTPSHNTILVDGKGQCRKALGRKRDFSMDWTSDYVFRTAPGLDYARCTYADGYGEKAELQGVTHRRTVVFVKRSPILKPFFVVIDRLTATDGKPHAFETLWHLDGGNLAIVGNRFVDDFGGGVTLTGVSSDPAVFVDRKGTKKPLQGWMPIWDESKEHEHRPVPTPVQAGTFSGSRRFVTFLQPNERGETSPVARIDFPADGGELDFTLVLADGERLAFRDVAESSKADPLALPSYTRRIDVTFANAAEAERAKGWIAPLPDGARLSFGTRWDDTANSDVPKAEMLNTIGAKASFYFNGGADKQDAFAKLGGTLRDLGHAVGNHSQTHTYVQQLSPNGFCREVLDLRLMIERAINRTINSYVSPFGTQRNLIDPAQQPLFTKILVETGHYVTGDNPRADLGQPHVTWYPAYRFYANDEKPDPDELRKSAARMLAQALADPDAPRLTLGTHAWCGAAGNEIQRKFLAELCAGKPWVHQSDWEYGAYRYQAINGSVRKVATKGGVATFEVTAFDPAALSSDVALSLKFDPKPVRVGDLAAGANDTWKLPHADGRTTVSAVDVADANGVSERFPGLTLALAADPAKDEATVVFTNGSKQPLSRVFAVLHMPPVWRKLRQTCDVGTLAPGAVWKRTFALGKRARADYAEDAAFWAASVDFASDGRVARLWARAETPGEGLGFVVPREGSKASPYLAQPWPVDGLKAGSDPSAPLPGGDAAWTNATHRLSGNAWFVIGETAMMAPDVRGLKRPLTRYIVWDFTMPAEGALPVRTNCGGGTYYLNGRAFDFKRTDARCATADLAVRAGKNRLIVCDLSYDGKRAMPKFLFAEPFRQKGK